MIVMKAKERLVCDLIEVKNAGLIHGTYSGV